MVRNTPNQLSILWKLFLKLVKGRSDDSILSLKATFSSGFIPEIPAYCLNLKKKEVTYFLKCLLSSLQKLKMSW